MKAVRAQAWMKENISTCSATEVMRGPRMRRLCG